MKTDAQFSIAGILVIVAPSLDGGIQIVQRSILYCFGYSNKIRTNFLDRYGIRIYKPIYVVYSFITPLLIIFICVPHYHQFSHMISLFWILILAALIRYSMSLLRV